MGCAFDFGGNTDLTSFLRQVDGAVGGVAAGLEEGGEAGEELPFVIYISSWGCELHG